MAMRKTTDKPQGGYLTTAVTDAIEGKWAGSELAFPDHIYLSRGKPCVALGEEEGTLKSQQSLTTEGERNS